MADDAKTGGESGAIPQAGTPEWTNESWYGKIPEGVRDQIPEDVYKEIHGGTLRQKDYTQKTQKVKHWEELDKKLQGRDVAAEIELLDKWRGWQQKDWPVIEQQLAEFDRLKRSQPAPAAAPGNARPVVWGQVTPDDLLEAERLQTTLAKMEEQFAGAASKAWETRWQQQELPQIQKYADALTGQLVNLLRVIWPTDKPAIDTILKEAYARGKTDYPALLQELEAERKPAEDAVAARVREQTMAELRNQGWAPPPAPPGVGAGMSWKRPAGVPQNDDKLFETVMNAVQKKHGPLPI